MIVSNGLDVQIGDLWLMPGETEPALVLGFNNEFVECFYLATKRISFALFMRKAAHYQLLARIEENSTSR